MIIFHLLFNGSFAFSGRFSQIGIVAIAVVVVVPLNVNDGPLFFGASGSLELDQDGTFGGERTGTGKFEANETGEETGLSAGGISHDTNHW